MSRGNIGVAVIGGGYGDEGKGLVTGFWAQNLRNPLVIRFNGGAQAGHSRELKDGRRHIFSHFGSGTFEGAPTFLSKYFVINPIQFRREHEAFVKEFGIVPEWMDTGAACRTFNVLLSEDRAVAAALIAVD